MTYNQPLSGNEMPRFAGPGTFMRLPGQATAEGLDVGFVGVPVDIGTSNRPGARYGPRSVRAESVMIRPYQMATGAAPFDSLQIADLGDVPIDTFDLGRTVDIVQRFYADVLAHGCRTLSIGGDHVITLPILRAHAEAIGPRRIGLVHVDAHADVNDEMFGERVTHGTWLRRAVEEDLVDPARCVQIGLRATGYSADDFDWSRRRGIRVVEAEACWHRSLAPLMDDVRTSLGPGPVYVSFDIDGLDPAFAPGTGTPEFAGLTSIQGYEIVRGCHGLEVIGGDLVEVSPPYDPSGNTSMLGANLLYEMLCVLPGVRRR
ncbi:MAG: agmatinase [Betaproteobacteria bacterium]|nr:agmatinase [Betaproteobacteria bacterium]